MSLPLVSGGVWISWKPRFSKGCCTPEYLGSKTPSMDGPDVGLNLFSHTTAVKKKKNSGGHAWTQWISK